MSNQIKEQYNKYAKGYTEATIRPMREFAYNPTILNSIKNLKGKLVLDIACGEGISSRMMKELGAKKVVGIDISDKLIRKAKEVGGDGIDYFVSDIFSDNLSKFGKFDVVTGIMILHYADSLNKLKNLIKNISKALKQGGVFYSLTVNPKILSTGYKNYGIKISRASKEGDSVLVELHDFNWNKFCEFTNYYWRKETYNNSFQELGFTVEWLNGFISKKGVREYGEDFWKDFFKSPVYLMISVEKK